MNDKSTINLNANTTGQVDPDSDEKGQVIEYTYKIKYIRLPPDATEKDQAFILSQPTNIGDFKSATGVTVLQTFSDNRYTYYKYSNGQFGRYSWSTTGAGGFKSGGIEINEKQYQDAKLAAYYNATIIDKDIRNLYGGRKLLSLQRPEGVRMGDVMVVEVGNNIGLPTYNYSQPEYFHVGQ